MAPISQMTTLAHLMIGMGVLFAILGVAGFVLRSFSYPLALLLAVLFGVAGVLSWFARTARQKWTLFGIATLIALSATYVWVVGGGAGLGGPPALRGSATQNPGIPGSCAKQTATRLVNEFFVKGHDHDINGVAGLLASDVSFTDNVGGQMGNAKLVCVDDLLRDRGERAVVGPSSSSPSPPEGDRCRPR